MMASSGPESSSDNSQITVPSAYRQVSSSVLSKTLGGGFAFLWREVDCAMLSAGAALGCGRGHPSSKRRGSEQQHTERAHPLFSIQNSDTFPKAT